MTAVWFIPVISATSERRDEGYFRREWSLAVDRTRDMAHKRAVSRPGRHRWDA
jgi:hypothetical protein